MPKLSGIYCPACDRQQIESELVNEHQGYRCAAQNHRYEYQRLMAMKPRMKKILVVEKQPGNTQTQTIWVYPEVWQTLHNKFPSNLLTTLCALLTALADDDTFIVEGEYARELHELGVEKGREVVGLAKTNIELTKHLDEARLREKVLEPILKLLGGAAGAAAIAPAAANPAQPTTSPDLPPRQVFSQPLPDPDLEDPQIVEQQVEPANLGMRGIPRPSLSTNVR